VKFLGISKLLQNIIIHVRLSIDIRSYLYLLRHKICHINKLTWISSPQNLHDHGTHFSFTVQVLIPLQPFTKYHFSDFNTPFKSIQTLKD
jgi:hypothetical protein